MKKTSENKHSLEHPSFGGAGGRLTEKVVRITVLKPFHIGVDNPVYYKPGSVEVTEDLANKLIRKGLAKAGPKAEIQQEEKASE